MFVRLVSVALDAYFDNKVFANTCRIGCNRFFRERFIRISDQVESFFFKIYRKASGKYMALFVTAIERLRSIYFGKGSVSVRSGFVNANIQVFGSFVILFRIKRRRQFTDTPVWFGQLFGFYRVCGCCLNLPG